MDLDAKKWPDAQADDTSAFYKVRINKSDMFLVCLLMSFLLQLQKADINFKLQFAPNFLLF